MDALVSKPDHGEEIIEKFNENLVASQRLQIFFDDIADKINEIGGGTGGGSITVGDFDPSSIIYRPSTGTAIAPAVINPNEFLGRAATGEIQGLDFSEAWGILGNGTDNIIINNTGGANLFTVESNTSSTMFRVDGSNERVGIALNGLIPNDGLVHILNSNPIGGVVTADPDGNDLVISHDLFGGLSILTGSNTFGNIFFGSPAYDNRAGNIWFLHDTDFVLPRMGFDVREKTFLTMYDTIGSIFNDFQDTDIDFQINTLGSAPFLQVDSSGNRMGLSQGVSFAPTDGILHIFDQGVAGVVTAPANADAIVIESPGPTGITILSSDTGRSSIILGHPADNDDCEIRADWVNNWLNVSFDSTDICRMNSALFTWNPLQDDSMDFQVMSENSINCLRVSALSNRVSIADSGTQGNQGLVHMIVGGLSGADAPASGSTLILDANTMTGMTLLSPDTGFGSGIYFGNPASDPVLNSLRWAPTTEVLFFTVGGEDAIRFNGTTGTHVNAGQSAVMDFQVSGGSTAGFFYVDVGLELVSISKSSLVGTDGTFHIINADNSVSASANGNLIVLENSGEMGMSFLTSNTGFANMYYGNAANGATIGHWRFDATNSTLEYFQNARSNFLLAPLENVFNEGGLSNIDLRAESDNNTKKLWLDASADELYTRAGGATVDAANARIGGTLSTDNATQGTTAVTTEETLLSFSLPAFSLGVNGQGVRIRAWGTTAANGNNKNIRLKFGATNVLATGAVASNGETWYFEADVYRTGAATQDAIGKPYFYVAGINGGQITNPAEALNGAVVIAVSGQNGTASANDIVAEGLTVEYI